MFCSLYLNPIIKARCSICLFATHIYNKNALNWLACVLYPTQTAKNIDMHIANNPKITVYTYIYPTHIRVFPFIFHYTALSHKEKKKNLEKSCAVVGIYTHTPWHFPKQKKALYILWFLEGQSRRHTADTCLDVEY